MTKKIKKLHKSGKDYSGKILKLLSKNSSKSFNYKQLAAVFEVNDTKSRNEIIKELKYLLSKQKIEETERGKFQIAEQSSYFEGVVDMTSRKTAYFVSSDFEEDPFIPENNLNKALHGDKVKVYVYNKRKGKKPEAEVIEVLERKKDEFVGVIQMHGTFAFVVSANPKMYVDLFIPKDKFGEAENGDVVLVKMTDWPEKAANPYAKVIKVLGKPGEHNTEMHAILAEYGLPSEFPIEVETYAQKLDTSITEEEIAKRRDMRDVLTFTIDPRDAKDFDDALSFQVLENGNYEIGVHIADVSHYVQEGTILDEEAYNRATSIYLVDRVVPMLPEVLSNFACSLRPNEEKYTFSAVFELNKKAEIMNSWFGRTVTYSDKRMAYEEAQVIIETKEDKVPADISLTGVEQIIDKPIVEAILKMDDLAKKLRAKRMAAGAISFDKVEVKFHLDENDEPTGVYFKVSKDANHLIEEFMLLANRKVSEFIGKQKKTFVYRIHDEPDQDKLFNLQAVISKFGYGINFKSKNSISQSLNKLLSDVQGKKEQNMVDTLTIRSMSKAAYSTHNIGHYGLAFQYYSHFTSPIRRYPDLMAHRLLKHYANGGASVDRDEYEARCEHCSGRERAAVEAERESIKLKQVEYIREHLGASFDGVISGVTKFGIFVELNDILVEGMVHVRDMDDDFYEYDDRTYRLVGRHSG